MNHDRFSAPWLLSAFEVATDGDTKLEFIKAFAAALKDRPEIAQDGYPVVLRAFHDPDPEMRAEGSKALAEVLNTRPALPAAEELERLIPALYARARVEYGDAKLPSSAHSSLRSIVEPLTGARAALPILKKFMFAADEPREFYGMIHQIGVSHPELASDVLPAIRWMLDKGSDDGKYEAMETLGFIAARQPELFDNALWTKLEDIAKTGTEPNQEAASDILEALTTHHSELLDKLRPNDRLQKAIAFLKNINPSR